MGNVASDDTNPRRYVADAEGANEFEVGQARLFVRFSQHGGTRLLACLDSTAWDLNASLGKVARTILLPQFKTAQGERFTLPTAVR